MGKCLEVRAVGELARAPPPVSHFLRPASLLEVTCIYIQRDSFLNLLMPYRPESDAKIQLLLLK